MTRGRAVQFLWPVSDVDTLRAAHRAARKVYRSPSPETLSLTLSSFTETAYRVARPRVAAWRPLVPTVRSQGVAPDREALAVTWTVECVLALEDDWEDLAALADEVHRPASGEASRGGRPKVLKADVARVGILHALEDWDTWVRGCPNDARRARG